MIAHLEAQNLKILQPRAIRAVEWLLLLILAYLLAQFTWSLFRATSTNIAPPTTTRAAPAKTQPMNARQKVQRIVAAHLFGTATSTIAPVVKDAPETRLRLTLSGVIATEDETIARALIAGPDGEEQSYAVGAELPGNAKLRAIRADHVLLERQGRTERLALPDEPLAAAQAVSIPRVTNSAPPRSRVAYASIAMHCSATPCR